MVAESSLSELACNLDQFNVIIALGKAGALLLNLSSHPDPGDGRLESRFTANMPYAESASRISDTSISSVFPSDVQVIPSIRTKPKLR